MQKIKRVADMLEKFAVGAMVMGIFQDAPYGIFLGTISAFFSIYMTKGKS